MKSQPEKALIDKKKILVTSRQWFVDVVVKSHIRNTIKLADPREFNINPFLVAYLAKFLTGNDSPESIARVLVTSRALVTSINTIFGNEAQKLIIKMLASTIGGSAISGIDIEFIDQTDGRKKYCQLKSGPQTINDPDVETIHNHFRSARNIARTNGLDIRLTDLVVGIIYGEQRQLGPGYRNLISKHGYPIFIGNDFWLRLTGDANFYLEFIQSIASAAEDFNSSELLEKTIEALSKTEEIKKFSSSK